MVSYNTKDLTRDCLRSIYEKTQGIEFEIFVVDNNSHDGSPEMIEQEFPEVRLIRNSENKGFGAANNIAIRQSNAKYIFCLNTDTILLNNAVKIFFDFMEHPDNQNVGVCGGALYDSDNCPTNYGGQFPSILNILRKFGLRNIFKKKTINYDKDIINVDYITGADIFFRKSVLDLVGLFDENFFMYYEETDLCFRIKKQGYNVKLIIDAKIIHLESKSCTNNLIRKKRFKTSEFIYFSKYYKYQYFLIKILYIILYFIDGYIFNNIESKEMFRFILK